MGSVCASNLAFTCNMTLKNVIGLGASDSRIAFVVPGSPVVFTGVPKPLPRFRAGRVSLSSLTTRGGSLPSAQLDPPAFQGRQHDGLPPTARSRNTPQYRARAGRSGTCLHMSPEVGMTNVICVPGHGLSYGLCRLAYSTVIQYMHTYSNLVHGRRQMSHSSHSNILHSVCCFVNALPDMIGNALLSSQCWWESGSKEKQNKAEVNYVSIMFFGKYFQHFSPSHAPRVEEVTPPVCKLTRKKQYMASKLASATYVHT